jgi:hypothetical protein
MGDRISVTEDIAADPRLIEDPRDGLISNWDVRLPNSRRKTDIFGAARRKTSPHNKVSLVFDGGKFSQEAEVRIEVVLGANRQAIISEESSLEGSSSEFSSS